MNAKLNEMEIGKNVENELDVKEIINEQIPEETKIEEPPQSLTVNVNIKEYLKTYPKIKLKQ